MIPSWGDYLSDLTLAFRRSLEAHPERRGTLIICLPRIEFAWCFVAFGFARSLAPAAPVVDHLARLKPYIGHWVMFTNLRGDLVQGVLSSVPDSLTEGSVEVVVRKQRVASLKLGKAPKTSEILEQSQLPSVQIISDDQEDEDAGFQMNYAPAPEFPDELVALAQRLLGPRACDWLEDTQGLIPDSIAAYGTRGRMACECNAKIGIAEGASQFRLSEILKPGGKGFLEPVGRIRVLPSSSLARLPGGGMLPSLVLVESLTRAQQLLALTSQVNRILLLARNAPGYNDSAEALHDSYRHRLEPELPCSAKGDFPYIFHKSFIHA
jgi:hypothetical protein